MERLVADPVVDRLRTVGRILRLEATFGTARLAAAWARALTFAAPTHQTSKHILTQGLDHQRAPTPVAPPAARTVVRRAVALLGHVFGGAAWN